MKNQSFWTQKFHDMKKVILMTCFILAGIVYGQDDIYFKTMKNTLFEMDTAVSMESMQLIANKFERIANVEKDKWLPNYYASFTYVLMSYREEDNKIKDQYLDKAEELSRQEMLRMLLDPTTLKVPAIKHLQVLIHSFQH